MTRNEEQKPSPEAVLPASFHANATVEHVLEAAERAGIAAKAFEAHGEAGLSAKLVFSAIHHELFALFTRLRLVLLGLDLNPAGKPEPVRYQNGHGEEVEEPRYYPTEKAFRALGHQLAVAPQPETLTLEELGERIARMGEGKVALVAPVKEQGEPRKLCSARHPNLSAPCWLTAGHPGPLHRTEGGTAFLVAELGTGEVTRG